MTIHDHSQRILGAVHSNDAARSQLIASWRRCVYSHKLDPGCPQPQPVLSDGELGNLRENQQRILLVSHPILEQVQGMIGDSGCCTILAAPNGFAIDCHTKPTDRGELERWGLRAGANWSEASMGTNGIGTCIAERRPIVIDREQHFFQRATKITCAVAPIFGPDSELVAALNISCYLSRAAEYVRGFMSVAVTEAARRIETDLFREEFGSHRIMSVGDTRMQSASMIAIDKDDVVVGATLGARRTLKIDADAIKRGIPIADLFGEMEDTMDNAARAVLRRALVRNGGNVSAAARDLAISRATMKRKINQFGLRRHVG